MIPVPCAGVYQGVRGIDRAEALAGEVIITAKQGQLVLPLPEGDTYLGFLFAYGEKAAEVEARLRQAHKHLEFEIVATLPVVSRPAESGGTRRQTH